MKLGLVILALSTANSKGVLAFVPSARTVITQSSLSQQHFFKSLPEKAIGANHFVETGPRCIGTNIYSASAVSLSRIKLPLPSMALKKDFILEKSSESFGSKAFAAYEKSANIATNLFPFWTVLFTGIALKSPEKFAWFTTKYFTAALAALMLSMGITLTVDDFKAVATQPVPTIVQFTLCYGMMPFLALGLGKLMGLSGPLIAGMVLVGSINGGQASNLCTYIAKGNVALSVLMTTVTTLGAIVMTPLLCKTLLGAVVPVDAAGIAVSTVQVVLAPIVVGMTLNKFFPKVVKKILPFAPVVGVLSTCLLVGSAVAQVSDPILKAGLSLQLPCMLLHLIGGIVGYWLPKAAGFDEVTSRTMAIETSMKSSAFGFLLAKLHFGDYAARIPSAVSVVWMALMGSLLGVVWRFIPVKDGSDKK